MPEKNEYVKLWLSYESYFEPYSDVEVGRLVRAMMKYRASREEPEFNGNERYVWPAIRRDIDESIRAQESISEKRSDAGKLGGRPKEEKPNAFLEKQKKQMLSDESKKSYGQGQGKGQGKGHSQGHGQERKPSSSTVVDDDGKRDAVTAVLADYLDRINASASPASLDELRGYAEELGESVCKRAFDIALDNKKATWNYIRAILRDKQAKGVRSLADWDALEKNHGRTSKPEEGDLSWMRKYVAERDNPAGGTGES